MRSLLALMLLAMLAGCVTTPALKPLQQQLKGEVHFPHALSRPAMVEVAVLSVIGGRPLQVATTRYEVTMLPLLFDVRLTPLQLAEGNIYIRATLRFMDSSVIQAINQQKVFKIFNGEKIVIQLQPKHCYPYCQ
ncbi:type III secretion system chaperone YscW [Aeromonas australiensis]|uniref:YscW family type III secretion system pilotin n=1 Tax=Aeromonas australiensis TaxID=1114880 RepID=UPI001F320DE5|nr:YscW family type III secretion system pilotin [Aeromonas australiensis]MCF3098580.1 type III secretion system chaperone YscW [Aeromonas australiensis]